MKSENIVKALKKCGYKVERIVEDYIYREVTWVDEQPHYKEIPSQKISYRAESEEYVGTWYEADNISSVHVVSKNMEKEGDISADYFPGTFCRTIKQICQFMEPI